MIDKDLKNYLLKCYNSFIAEMAELVDAQDSKSCEDFPHEGSIPSFGILKF